MLRRKKKKNKGSFPSNKTRCDGFVFASGLEKYTYLALKRAKLFEKYEGEQFILIDPFEFKSSAYERQANGKGDYKERGNKKIQPIKYTPDFTGVDYIIECKGRANESFPLRYKLFKRWLSLNNDSRRLFKPQNQAEVEMTVQLIKEQRKKYPPSTTGVES